MARLETIGQLPQPPFETGKKNIGNVLERRLVQGRGVYLINRLTLPHLSQEISNLKFSLEMAEKQDGEFFKPAWELINANTIFLPNEVFIRASSFHCDNWSRDTFIGTLFLENPRLERHLLSLFEKAGDSPQLPTNRLFPGERIWRFDDESTMLGLIWRYKLLQQDIPLEPKEREAWKKRWGWISQHVHDGFYVTPAGTEHSWFDTFKYPAPDSITYNQGIYAVAALAAQRMGLEKDNQRVLDAMAGYQKLVHSSGRLQHSYNCPYLDASALFGEFLAMDLFSKGILSDETVRKTVEAWRQTPKWVKGLPIVLNECGGYLLSSEFNRPYLPGVYHNGAEWPAWSAIAQATAELHGARHDRAFWQDLLAKLENTNQPEYFYTNPDAKTTHNPKMENHLWNTVVYLAASMVITEGEQVEIVRQREKPRQGILYSEASQISQF